MKKFSKFFTTAVLATFVPISASEVLANGAYRGSLKDQPAIAYSWSGLYFGAHAGYAWADADWSVKNETSVFWDNSGGAGTAFSQDAAGFIGGGQIGYNFQTGPWVLGLEASLSGADLKDSRFAATITGDDLRTTKIGSMALLTARFGYAWDQWLAYVKGGYATATVRAAVSDVLAPNVGSWSSSERHHGWTIGAGLEYMLMRNVTLGLEYNYVDLGSKQHSAATSDGGSAAVDVDASVHAVWARLNFKLTQ